MTRHSIPQTRNGARMSRGGAFALVELIVVMVVIADIAPSFRAASGTAARRLGRTFFLPACARGPLQVDWLGRAGPSRADGSLAGDT